MGPIAADNQNMYEAMRTALYVSHVRGPDTNLWLETAEILGAATEGSARALGMQQIGKIATGYKADIVFLDLGAINWIPMNDPVNQLVQTEDGTSVHSVMVGGKFAVRDRKLVNVLLGSLAKDVETARQRLAGLNRERQELAARLAPVVNSFCPALAREPYHVHRYGAPAHAH